MGFNLSATSGRLIVETLDEQSNKTAGGILLSVKQNADIHKGRVVSVGDKLKDATQNFTLGQIVYWSNYSGVDYEFENKDYKILNQSDIIAVEQIYN